MKANSLFSLLSSALLIASCSGSNSVLTVDKVSLKDSTSAASLSMAVDIPSSEYGVSGAVRRTILEIATDQLSSILADEDLPYPAARTEEELSESFKLTFATMDKMAKADDTGREGILMEAEINIDKLFETSSVCVFSSHNYVYLGGAHGGISGEGYVTFDKGNGRRFSDFIKEGSEAEMQELIRKGLCEYFSSCSEEEIGDDELDSMLLVDGDIIPLPANDPCPTETGLLFEYQQYEIACYAAGMPSFEISHEDILPFLTPEAVSLLTE